MPNRFYSQKGAPKYQPGCLTRSDSRSTIGQYPLGSPSFARTAFGAGFFPPNSTIPITITLTGSNQQVSIVNVIVGAIVDLTDIVNQIQQSLPPGLTVLYSSASAAFQIDTNVPGLFGNFSVLISGNPIAPSITPVDNTPLIAGRYVVPVIDNLDLGLEQFDSTPRYRYPIISDNSNLLYSGGFVIFDGHTNISLNSLINDNGLVTQATNFAVLKRGCIAVLPATALPSATAAIFMHTLNSGSNLAGSLTVTPSATTIPVTGGLLTILSGSNVAGRICEIQKLDY